MREYLYFFAATPKTLFLKTFVVIKIYTTTLPTCDEIICGTGYFRDKNK